MRTLIDRWTADLAALAPSASAAASARLVADLLARWAEPHRRYHATQHLVEMLDALDALTDARDLDPHDARLARVAAWFHDAVYAPKTAAGADESASAALADDRLGGLGMSPADRAVVVSLITMTADHVVTDGSAVAQGFHDADLWILAAPVARFDAYCEQVREEYAAVPDDVFGPARSAILRDLVGDAGLYLTPHARRHWDEPARANLARELSRLG